MFTIASVALFYCWHFHFAVFVLSVSKALWRRIIASPSLLHKHSILFENFVRRVSRRPIDNAIRRSEGSEGSKCHRRRWQILTRIALFRSRLKPVGQNSQSDFSWTLSEQVKFRTKFWRKRKFLVSSVWNLNDFWKVSYSLLISVYSWC